MSVDQIVLAGCRHATCGCGGTWDPNWEGNAQNTCIGTDCWYNPDGSGGCTGHSWYFSRVISYPDCTSGGTYEYDCSICNGVIYKYSSPLGHDWGSWHEYSDSKHEKTCKRCGADQYQNHSMSGWIAGGDGYLYKNCTKCTYGISKPITFYVDYKSNYPSGATGNGFAMSRQTFVYNEFQNLYTNRFGCSYTVRYDTNQGIYPSVPTYVTTPVVAEAAFAGWARGANGAVQFGDGQQVRNLTRIHQEVVNLYAKWNLASIRLPYVSRSGFTFTGWYDAATDGNKIGDAGETYTPTSSLVLYARWIDNIAPLITAFQAVPNSWSSGDGTIIIKTFDEGTGIDHIVLERTSLVDRSVSTVATYHHYGTVEEVTDTYFERNEGVFYYTVYVWDRAGNVQTKISPVIYLDHSNPIIYGVGSTETEWTNVAPIIQVNATDYLYGTAFTGSGLKKLEVIDDAGNVVASGIDRVAYTLENQYEGIHSWTVVATDMVDHSSQVSITTKYDMTKPGIDGTEITVVEDGVKYAGYCQDNIIDQHIDDESIRSVNNPNVTSGIRSVVFYKVDGDTKEAFYSDHTYAFFDSPDTHSSFDLYYDANEEEEYMDSYLIVVSDYAGNVTKKKLTCQRSLLTWFHTSIDRSSYEN